MDENGIWYVSYNQGHELFPDIWREIKRKGGWTDDVLNRKGYKDLVNGVYSFCHYQGFILEGSGHMVDYRSDTISWYNKDVLGHHLPSILYPVPKPSATLPPINAASAAKPDGRLGLVIILI